jgi:PPK2 family polyphosphate:nucleotide phosphotransferase
MTDRYLVKPGEKVKLSEWDPDSKGDYPDGKQEGKEDVEKLNRELEELQELLYAEHKHKVLVILQGMDASGKDGTIRHVFDGVNPQGVKVASFKVPTKEELDHDYLWRVHKRVPGKGEIVIFNRSHYEDVLAVRVLNLAPKAVWSKRYDHINDFEKTLADEGTTILKFFLHISAKEQKERLLARLKEPHKQWKFNPADLKARGMWQRYVKAYEDVLSKTSTKWAPWYIIPSNRKWYRNLVVGEVIIEALKSLKMKYPKPTFDPKDYEIE